jgi:hypothetical protein
MGVNVESLKRGHWIGIGAAAGLLLALCGMSMPSTPIRSITQQQFEDLIHQQPRPGLPALTDVDVRPAVGGYVVTGNRLMVIYDKLAYGPFTLQTNSDPVLLLKTNPALHYRYAWWANPPTAAALYAAGGALLIGGVWPLALQLMVAGGLGRRQADAYDLTRFGGEPAADKPHAPDVEHGDVAIGGVDRADAAPAQAQATDQPSFKALDSTPLEAMPTSEADAAKEYEGEFYPTEAHAHHGEGGSKQA